MTLAKTKTYIKCKGCGKEIELKCGREYCIKCRNQMDKERQRGYRENEDYREKYRAIYRERYWAEKKGGGGLASFSLYEVVSIY